MPKRGGKGKKGKKAVKDILKDTALLESSTPPAESIQTDARNSASLMESTIEAMKSGTDNPEMAPEGELSKIFDSLWPMLEEVLASDKLALEQVCAVEVCLSLYPSLLQHLQIPLHFRHL